METNKIADCIDRIYGEHFLAFPVGQLADNRVIGSFFKYQLESRFQPIVRLEDGVAIGHDSMVECHAPDGSQIEAARLFALALDNSGLVSLDRMVRTLHALNYFAVQEAPGRLFLSVQHRLLETVKSDHGRFFERILQQFDIATGRVVIQLPQRAQQDVALLGRVIRNYRSRGYGVAVEQQGDDLGWLEVVGDARPDFIKWQVTSATQERLRQAATLAQGLGVELVATGVDNAHRAERLAATAIKLGQGAYYTAFSERVDGAATAQTGRQAREVASTAAPLSSTVPPAVVCKVK